MKLSINWIDDGLIPLIVATALLGLLVLIIPINMDIVLLGDGTTYTHMVENLWVGEGHMHRFRILTPLLVHWLPFGVDMGFRAVTVASCWLTSLVLYWIARVIGWPSRTALLAVPMPLLTWPTLWNVYQYRTVDPLALLFASVGLMLLLSDHPVAAILVAGVGLLAKEAVFFIIPLAVFRAARTRNWRGVVWLMIIAVVALAPYLAVRLKAGGGSVMQFHGGMHGNASGISSYVADHVKRQLVSVGAWQSLFYMVIPFGALWLLGWVGIWRVSGLVRQTLLGWIGLSGSLIFFGTPERMLEFVAPALLPLAVSGLQKTPRWVSLLVIVGNGLCILRVTARIVPFWLAWSLEGCAMAVSGWIWLRSFSAERTTDAAPIASSATTEQTCALS